MKVYHPKVEIILFKSNARERLVPASEKSQELGVHRRYSITHRIDLTKYLGEGSAILVGKGIYEQAGYFSFSIPDKIVWEVGDSLYAIVEPMDYVEIRMAHDPSTSKSKDKTLPMLMRGFVSDVGKSESIQNGKPVRMVNISGRDYGKILHIIRIFYNYIWDKKDPQDKDSGFFDKYMKNSALMKLMQANEFMKLVCEKIIDPYLAEFFKNLKEADKKNFFWFNAPQKFTLKSDIEGVISPYIFKHYTDVSLYQMISDICDVGAFNEFFVEDTEEGVNLVLRPAPFIDPNGKLIQGNADKTPKSLQIDEEDVVSTELSRNDEGVANYFWVRLKQYDLMHEEDVKAIAYSGDRNSFVFDSYINTMSAVYGFRKMEISANLLPKDYSRGDAPTQEEQETNSERCKGWTAERRALLARINRDNVLFEKGTIVVRGNEKIKAGMYISIIRGGKEFGKFYVVKVTHAFTPYRNYLTTLQVDRGTSYITRLQADTSPYYREISGRGVR
jgi:hypothetical protein